MSVAIPEAGARHEADDRTAVMRTVGCEGPSGLISDDEGNHGGISEGVVGESFELAPTSALGASLSPRHEYVVAGERGLGTGEPRRSDELAASCCHLRDTWPRRAGRFRPSAATLSRVTPSARARSAQVSRSSTELDVELVAPRLQTRRLARPRPGSPGALELRLDRVPPLREVAQHLALEALELGQAAPVRNEPLATELGDAFAKLGAIDRSRRAFVQIDHAGVERGPSPVASFGDVANNPMRMELRVEPHARPGVRSRRRRAPQ